MDKKSKAAPKIAEIAGKIYSLLEPLSSEDRRKVINASLTLLGEISIADAAGGGDGGAGSADTMGGSGKSSQHISGLHAKANNWIKQAGLTKDEIEQVFDITSDGIPVIISEVPGRGRKEQTHNAYVLLGISRFLTTGDTAFDDKTARKLCEDLGCYDSANHSVFMGDKGNLLTGSKKTGWKLTAPGLKHGANLVKQANGNGQ